MATTALIVDFLVIGLVSLIWLGPVAASVLGADGVGDVLSLSTGMLPALLGMAYIVGIAISRFADDLLDSWNDRWRIGVFGQDTDPSYHARLNLVIAKSESASEYLAYRRSVIRTARACAVNFAMGIIAWTAVAASNPRLVSPKLAISVAVACGAISCLLIRTWKVVLGGYFCAINDLYEILRDA